MSPRSKILVTPLDWGLGHATRCIPIIKELLKQGSEVQLATSGDALSLLRKEFPSLKFHEIASYRPAYGSILPLLTKMVWQLPKFSRAIRSEHRQVTAIVEKESIDIIISDNRYGCWNKKTKNVFVTHQVSILLNGPWKIFSGWVNYFIHRQIRKFDTCWVPDVENGITGRLTVSKEIPLRFIGILSRFEKMRLQVKYELAVVLSGPEPQRTLIENKLRTQLSSSGLKYFLVKGKLSAQKSALPNEADYLTSTELNELIESSEIVICRSGYSSIMDLMKLGKKAIFIPTPGQTEQEYLAIELEKKGIAFYQTQNQFDLTEAIRQSKSYFGFDGLSHPSNLLPDAITDLPASHA